MPDFSSKSIIKLLIKAGFTLDRIKGSHHIYKHSNGKRAVVPHPKKDLPKGTYHSILKQAGI
ncbi:MAG: type II toxin-antitoxin system HicA family toxin [Reichenbachiella sp.]|uniref:type II toxin-antitoxin system HicA family toxin n=1 Tax=Reichenbachiella sp. TaxID=2184521 RepID=UPI0029662D9E|nr:type II toxin-antitoxin system HicA family toxin [Reichenbachiella sp.]MDW3208935.1 type II toxin-antitoxin system HicA family toxin [Reichenbachiella sp.]